MASASNAQVVSIRRRDGRLAHTVYQDEIEELLRRSKAYSEARESYDELHDYIKFALEAGAAVEQGMHSVSLKEIDRAGFPMPATKFKRLIVG